MNARICVVAVVSILLVGCSAPGVDLGKLSPKADRPDRPSPFLRKWGDGYAIVLTQTEPRTSALRWSRAFEARDADAFAEISPPGCGAVIDIAALGEERFALCLDGRDLSLHSMRDADSWQRESLPDAGSPDRLALTRLVVGAAHRAVISSTAISWRAARDTSWHVMPFVEPNEQARGWPPSRALMTSHALWLGYDHGEFGGSLQRAAIRSGVIGKPEQVVAPINVRGIAADDHDAVWVAGGLAHLGIKQAFLIRVSGSNIESIVSQGGAISEILPTPSHRLGSGTVFDTMAISPDGQVMVLDEDRGIYGFDGTSLRLVVPGKFVGIVMARGVIHVWGTRDMLALSDGAIILALSSGEIVCIPRGGEPRLIPLPPVESDAP